MSENNAIQQQTEEILGQFYFALGQGAGVIRIQREAITALRRRYADPITANFGRWTALAPNVLSFVVQVGRVAALQATQDGRTSITAVDFTRARQLVESRVHQSGERTHGLFAGPLCPPVTGEEIKPPTSEEAPQATDQEELAVSCVFAKAGSSIH